jgi:hypothetical protein
MNTFTETAHFPYSVQFWYNDPFREIKGLSEEQLFWVPKPVSKKTSTDSAITPSPTVSGTMMGGNLHIARMTQSDAG